MIIWFSWDSIIIFSLSRFRVACHFICNHSYFGNIVLVCIMVSSAMLAAEDPLNSKSERNQVRLITALSRDTLLKRDDISFPDLELLRLLFHDHLHDRGVPEGDRLRLHPPPGRVLPVGIQPTRSPRRRSLAHFIRVQVGRQFRTGVLDGFKRLLQQIMEWIARY